ncbi:MAG: potassium channel family protein, partial [Rhodococcus sp. (in: high G+C Gram-positive bacteria)]
MDAVQWLGIIILGLTLLDVFLTALNYDDAGFLTRAVTSWVWRVIRRVTRKMSRGRRPAVLRQVTGIQLIVTVGMWVGGTILGYAFIYVGMMREQDFLYNGGTDDAFGAIYFSTAQLSTVGTSQVVPDTDVSRIISVLETLTGVVLVFLILTFLLGVYGVISALRGLSAQFYNPGNSVGDPVASLKPYFPGGESRDLDSKLSSIADSFSSYTDGVRLHHSAYYFQSGRDTFSLPYSIRMLSGVVGALRWGLPRSHPVTVEPMLLPLTDQFLKFADYMHPLLGWTSTDVPETRSRGEFRRLIEEDIELHRTDGHRSAPPVE